MSMSTSFIADATFNSVYTPSDNTSSFVQIVGTTLNISNYRIIVNSTDDGVKGEICWGVDGGTPYLYLCTNTNTWVRSAFTTF